MWIPRGLQAYFRYDNCDSRAVVIAIITLHAWSKGDCPDYLRVLREFRLPTLVSCVPVSVLERLSFHTIRNKTTVPKLVREFNPKHDLKNHYLRKLPCFETRQYTWINVFINLSVSLKYLLWSNEKLQKGNRLTMASFRIVLSMLTVLGCMRPVTWTSSFKRFVYLVYTVIAYGLMQSLMLSCFLELLFNVKSQKDFSDVVIIMTAAAGSVCKVTTILVNRKNIVTLLKILRREPFLPVDKEEMDIKNRLDKIIE
ncbi:uncharacterized protein LOC143211155 [Lasioglossum baleicum]|uniref:uncharacterized protein LOC143211155 n=1 Tax=Lasioglossum baleicum TaxID=434251 RepID=UPI003FCEC592